MGLPDTSPVPKKDSMGMGYIPVYADETEDPNTVKVSLDKFNASACEPKKSALSRSSKRCAGWGRHSTMSRCSRS